MLVASYYLFYSFEKREESKLKLARVKNKLANKWAKWEKTS